MHSNNMHWNKLIFLSLFLYWNFPLYCVRGKFFGEKIEVPAISKFYKENFGDEKKVLFFLQGAMEERDRLLQDGQKENFLLLSHREYELENKAYNEFFKISGDAASNSNAAIEKINNSINLFIKYIKVKFGKKLFSYQADKNKFNTLSIQTNNQNFISPERVFSDNHTSKYLPIKILEGGLFNLEKIQSLLFYLGDTLDRYMELTFLDYNSKCNFLYKKYMALFLIKLFKMIAFHEQLSEDCCDISQENFFAVLGNHDFGSMLQQDFDKILRTKYFCESYSDILKICKSFDDFARFFIPSEIIVVVKKEGEKVPHEIHFLTHSGATLPFPDADSNPIICDSEVKNGDLYYKIQKYEYSFTLDKRKYSKILKKLSPQGKTILSNLCENVSKIEPNLHTPISTWCDYNFLDLNLQKDEKKECSILPSQESPGRYDICGIKSFFSYCFETIILNYFSDQNIEYSSLKVYRGHQHYGELISRYFIKKEENDYTPLSVYSQEWPLNKVFNGSSFQDLLVVMYFFPPCHKDNLWTSCFSSCYKFKSFKKN
jgi:hypothetical protein